MAKQNSTDKKSLPWLVPMVKRPKFVFPKIKLSLKLTIPTYFWLIVIYSIIFYVYMGGVYNTVVGNVPAYGLNDKEEIEIIKWDRSLRSQYTIEGFVAALMMFLAFFGLYLHRLGSLDPHNVRRAENYQFLGVVLIVVSLIVLEGMMHLKTLKKDP